MRYVLTAFVIGLIMLAATPLSVQARMGDMGFFGGISEGRRLPRTTETVLLEQGSTNARRGSAITMNYRELIFLADSEPVLFEGILEISSGNPAPDSDSGTFNVTYTVRPSFATTEEAEINRTMTFRVYYHREGNQMVYFYHLTNWTESINTPHGDFVLDTDRSTFNLSIIEDQTPGVSYYRGDVFSRRVFIRDEDAVVTVEQEGEFYGFSTAWSATETHRMNVSVVADGWALQYQIRPSVTVNKILQHVANEPTVISFEGNYREIHQSFAGLRYDIFVRPNSMWNVPMDGTINLETVNVFEQLHAPDLSFIRGNPAEDDIHRLFAMRVLQGDPRTFVPEQAITRGQFFTALARAIKLPVEQIAPARGRRQPVIVNLFTDVDSNRPEFIYIQAIQRAGIAYGRADGRFYFDYPISRQEAFTTTVRALGLTNMGLNPTVVTPFTDSHDIAYWAIREIGVAQMLGIIAPDENGNIHPNRAISKGEAAALFNHLIEYMRAGLVSEYAEQIVNIAR